MRVLIAEDQEEAGLFLKQGLEESGFAVDLEEDGEKAFYKARFSEYDLILSDLRLPNKNGLEILQDLRKIKILTPFIMVTVEERLEVKLEALEQGADDYLTKPFLLEELIAKASSLIRRNNYSLKREGEILTVGKLKIDQKRFKLFKNNKEIKLRRKEFDLLHFLMLNHNKTLSRALILEKVWDLHADPFTNTIDVHIRVLRKKIGDLKGRVIRTIYGRGYEFLA